MFVKCVYCKFQEKRFIALQDEILRKVFNEQTSIIVNNRETKFYRDDNLSDFHYTATI